MKGNILYTLLVLICTVLPSVFALDPCSASVYTVLGDLAKRDPNYAMDSVQLCDRYIDKKWYRAGFHRMATSAPLLGMCGTIYPYWMNDSTPMEGHIKAAKVCQVAFDGYCSKNHTIRVKNCGKFHVYELTPLDICPSSYCFVPDQENSCVSWTPSNVTVVYHSVSWTITKKLTGTNYDPDVNVACQFERLSEENLYYDITWYVDDTEIIRNQTISSNSSDEALLSGTQMLAKGKKANSLIHCLVGAKYKIDHSPCQVNASSPFFAGIKVLNSTISIPRGKSVDVHLQFTIPFISLHGISNLPHMLIDNQPALQIRMAVHNASSSVCDGLEKKACDTDISAYKFNESKRYNTDMWKEIHKIKVNNEDDGDVKPKIDKHITLRFKTAQTYGLGSKIFEEIVLSDVQVFVEDSNSSWKEAICESHTDPHMMTFDKKKYECQLDGTFVLYRNEIYQQEVQEKHHICHPKHTSPRCTCAVAVRSGKDVFIIDICNAQLQHVIHFPNCEDDVLKVFKKSDWHYKAIFPTGTIVEIKLVSWPYRNDWQLNINIYPSPSDVGLSSGLCGILDGNYKNDFTWNNPEKTVENPDHYHQWRRPHPDGFSKSWRVKNGDINLFDNSVYGSLKSITTVFDRVCRCNKNNKVINCSYGNYKDCKFAVGKRHYCIVNHHIQSRRKRDLHHLKSIKLSEPPMDSVIPKNHRKRETNMYLMSYEEAMSICVEAFQASDSYLMCQEHVSGLGNTSLVNCIADLMMTEDLNITKIHVEAALVQCSTFVVLNSTFQEVKPDITYRIKSICENNCSGNGICNSGNCTCNSGYAGSDCSVDLTGPPTITHISDFGFCDKTSEACDEITLYGRYFLENMDTTCYLKRKTVGEDGSVLSETNLEISLQERTLFEGYCPLYYNADYHWVTEFRFNISNDGSQFTDSYNVYTYQSLCQELKNDTGNITFTFKDGYCYINNTCVADGDSNPDNLCDVCITGKNKYQWTYNTGHCFIDGNCFPGGAINGTNPCSVCNPSLNITAWSSNPGFCFIDGICYFDDQTNPSNNCDICLSQISHSTWSFNEQYCLIDGLCVRNGDTNTIMDCQVCNTSVNKTSWQVKNDFCLIDYTCVVDGGANSTYPCHYCNVSINPSIWSHNQEYCLIDGLCIRNGDKNSIMDCQVCNTSVNKTIWQVKNDFCLIDDTCVVDGGANSTYPCHYCNVSINPRIWSHNPEYCLIDGLCVRNGDKNSIMDCQVCNTSVNKTIWKVKNDFCLIDDTCVVDGGANSTYPCHYCNVSINPRIWSHNPEYCLIDGLCVRNGDKNSIMDCQVCNTSVNKTIWQVKNDFCLIDDTCVVDGGANSTYPCHYCNVSINPRIWSHNPEYCLIDGLCVRNGDKNNIMDCQVCNTSVNKTIWQVKNDFCLIDDTCVVDGGANSTYPCHYCNVSINPRIWSHNPEYCLIDGLCVRNGDTNAIMDCQVCNTSVNKSSWQVKNDFCLIDDTCVVDGGANSTYPCHYCNVSINPRIWSHNTEYCLIDGLCVRNGDKNSIMDCQVCNTSVNKTIWQVKNDFCFIDDTCVVDGGANSTYPCHYCNVSINPRIWSHNPEYCLIDGLCVRNGDKNSIMDCQVCNTSVNKISWQVKNDFCLIGDICVVDGGENSTYPCHYCNVSINPRIWSHNKEYCLIDGLCVRNGDTNTIMDCQVCNSSVNKTSWQVKNDNCFIDGMCIRNGETERDNPCRTCNSTFNNTHWHYNTEYCLIADKCFSNGETNISNFCDVCNLSMSGDSWSQNPAYCKIGEQCIADGERNASNGCLYCNTTLEHKMWSLSEECLSPDTTSTITMEPKTTTEILQSTTGQLTPNESYATIKSDTQTTLQTGRAEDNTSTAIRFTTVQTTSTTEPTNTVQTSTTKPTSILEITTTEQLSTIESTTPAQTTSTAESSSTTEFKTVQSTKSSTDLKTTLQIINTAEKSDTTIKSTISQERTTEPSCVDMSINNIKISFHNVSWNTTIEKEGPTTRTVHNPYVNLKCSFVSSSSDNLLFYKVEWYVNDHTFVKSDLVGGSSVRHALLSLKALKSGIQITCKVGATKNQLISPCKMFKSEPFSAGIRTKESTLNLPRKGRGQIRIHLTVPFVTPTIILNETVQALRPLEIYINTFPMSENACKGYIGVDKCKVEITAFPFAEKSKYESDEWKSDHNITVYHIDTDGYSINTKASLFLKTSESEDGFFHNISFGNTLITVFEATETWKGKSCGSKTDPHLHTFDGVSFESHITGDFVLYRNWKFDQEVQTRHEKCHDSYPFPQCTCAVSVKSGRDLFMIDVCENNNFVDFLRCQDNVIKVYKEEDKLFKILLPMGTTVIASLVEWPVEGSWQIDIDIYPSLSDVNNTDGLCGTLDGDKGNEFTHRNGHKDSSSLEYPDDFSRSWMVQSNENLLNGAPSDLPSVPFSLDRICTCSANGDQCFYNAFSECSKTTGKQYYCGQTNLLQASRKRRGVHLSKNSVWSRQKRQESIYVTSEARAGNVCKTAFNRSESFEKCEEYVSDMTNVSLSNCIMDVRLTGDENIPSLHIEDALKQCVRLIVFNTTLKTQQPDVTNQIQSLCSNNCSGHGICKEGHCLCDSDFGGSDCSFDVRAPPTILRTSPNETCDMSSSNCSEVLLEGRYFLENINITCFITRQLVNHDNNAVDITDSEQPLDDRTLFHGACPLPKDSISTWITKFTLKISYDGKSFSRAFPIYIYKSECQQKSYVDGFGQFTLKAGYCYIDSKCVQKDVSKLGHSCEVCNPSSQKYDWSLHQDCVSTTSPPQTTKSPISTPAFIITVSIVSAVFVGTLVVIILAWRCRSSSKRHYKDDDSTKDINVAKWRKYFDEGDKLHNFYIPRGRRNNEQEYYTNSENTYRY